MNKLVILTLWFLSGISAYAAITHFLIGVYRPLNRLHLLFAGMCISVSLLTLTNYFVYQATDVHDYVAMLRLNLSCVIVLLIFLPWFFAEYTRVRPVPLLMMFNVLVVLFFVINLLQPYTIQYQEIQSLYRMRLPWGEEVTRAMGINGAWFKLAALAVLSIFAFSLYSLNVLYQRGRQRSALIMMLAIGILVLSSIEGILVRMSIIEFVELAPLTYTATIFVMSMVLSTEHKRIEKALVASEYKHRMLFEYANDAILLMKDQKFIDCNEKTLAMFDCKRTDIIGKTPVDFSPLVQPDGQNSSAKAQEKIQAACRREAQIFEWQHTRLNGQPFNAEISLNTFDIQGELCLLAIVRDITARKAAEERVEFLAYHDALTGLPNRLLAKDHFEMETPFADRANSKIAVIILDLDNFKMINDTLGHPIGDTLLRAVSMRLHESVHNSDTLSRLGGDEFLVLLTDMHDPESVIRATEKFPQGLVAPFDIEGHHLTTSLSIGIAVYPDDGKDFDTLLKKADTAMYQSKGAGRNTYRFYTEQMNIDAFENLRIRNSLQEAMDRKEFILHYQPQVDLLSDTVIGAEALIRWNHPELGLIPPGRFIQIAEECGLIVAIGDWVLLEACRQAVAWREAGLPEMVIAVNISAVQFRHHDLENSVIHALDDSGLDPSCLELELTESILIHDAETVLATLQRLKSLGVKLAIDDFGTGYSSLSYLKRFNVDKLKIDQSFIRNMADNPNDAAIVRAIIQMTRSLNIKTIAEGVEDERSLSLLRLQHCGEAQGYFFARPLPSIEFIQYIMSRPGL